METVIEAAAAPSATPAARPPLETFVQPPVAPPQAPAVKRKIPLAALIAAGLLLLAGAGFLVFRLVSPPGGATPPIQPGATAQASATLAAVAPTLAPSQTATLEPTRTPEPSQTPAPTATAAAVALVTGGADRIAYVQNSDVWIARVDGSDAQQLTSDGTMKSYLRWLPGGDGLSYISGKCLQTVDLQGAVASVTCFNNAVYFDSFEVSPDGTRVALSLDRQLYLLPFDLALLAKADSHPDLVAMADCEELAPYQRSAVLYSRWSKDGSLLAAVALGVLADGRRGDVVEVFAVDQCIANPRVQVQFPEPHFALSEYTRKPTLPGLAWDGAALFVLNGLTRNDYFGDLHIFNRESFTITTNADPVNSVCCYADPTFSPDGKYLLFAFQDITLGADSRTQLYYIPYGTLGTGATYQPLPLPTFTDPKEEPQAVLRPAKP